MLSLFKTPLEHLSWEQRQHFFSVSSDSDYFFSYFQYFLSSYLPEAPRWCWVKDKMRQAFLSLQGSFCLVKEIRAGQPLQIKVKR